MSAGAARLLRARKVLCAASIAAATGMLLFLFVWLDSAQGRWLVLPLLALLWLDATRHRRLLRLSDPRLVPLEPGPGEPFYWTWGVVFSVVCTFLFGAANGIFENFMVVPYVVLALNVAYTRTIRRIFRPHSPSPADGR